MHKKWVKTEVPGKYSSPMHRGEYLQENRHKPVLLYEVIGFLLPKSGGIYVDATVGGGGHAERILEESSPSGRLIGIDIDPAMLVIAQQKLAKFTDRCLLVNGNYVELREILHGLGVKEVNGIIFDLGVSTEHFTDPGRGFSILRNGPLDMRFSPTIRLTASEIINRWKPEDLIKILYQYGEERRAKGIVRYILEERKKRRIGTTGQLSELIIKAVGRPKIGNLHPATKTFQALRIAVNSELNNIEKGLPMAVDLVKPGGRLCVISFHSLEDRIVKNIFRNLSGSRVKIITKKPVIPTKEELTCNPRARSAKLRVAERM